MSAPASPQQWIYERGGQGSGGGPPGGGQPAPPAVIDGETHTLRNNDTWEIAITFHVPGATASNWAGVAIYVEDPDISGFKGGSRAPTGAGPIPPKLDGSTKLDGSSNLSGAWTPIFVTDATDSPVAIPIPTENVLRQVRIYLASFGPNSQPDLVRANSTTDTPTPSIDVQLLPQESQYVSGMEVAWLVTDVKVDVNYFLNQVPPQYSLTYSFQPPSEELEAHRPQGLGPFTGCAIKLDYGGGIGNLVYAGDHQVTPDQINAAQRISWTTTPYDLTNSFTVIAYFASESGADVNSVVLGVTPSYTVQITAPNAPGGGSGLAAPDVGGFHIVGTPSVEYQIDGSMLAIATFQWSLPADGVVRYAGMDLYRVATTGVATVPELIWSQTGSSDTSATVEISRIPTTAETWWIAAISVDFNGQLADDPTNFSTAGPGPGFHSPYLTWTVGPPGAGVMGGGIEYAPMVTINPGASAHATESTSSDGVRQVSFALTGTGGAWTNPTSNQFGGAWVAEVVNGDLGHPIWFKVPQGANSFTTPATAAPGAFGVAQTIDFYIVSQDPQDHRNTLVKGVTPKISITYTPTEGMIIPSRFNPSWFNQSEFVWDPNSNSFTTQSIGANKIQVGSILSVGGKNTFGGSQNGQIGVFDQYQNLIGWIGQQQGGQGQQAWSIYGAWFKQLWVGGSQPAYAPLWVDPNGIVQVGGIQALSGAPYPYISVRDAYGVEMGRIGAQLTNPPAPGDGNAVQSVPQGVTAGAWFTQLAAGGSSATQWQMLVANGQFFIRNTDVFQLDYAPNSITAPYNNQYVIQFGKGIWAGKGLTSSWQFPGFAIYENGGVEAGYSLPSVFGSVFISRGLVLRGTATQGHNVIAAFTVFNGDSSGSDQPPQFYGDLVMYCPTSPTNMNVHLSSGWVAAPGGAVNGDATFYMWNRNAHQIFSVDGGGNVYADNTVTALNYWVKGKKVIDDFGNWVGTPITAATGVFSINAAGSPALTGAIVLAAGANTTITQSQQTITISSSGGAGGAQTPWTQNIDARNNALNSVSAIRSYHMDPGSGVYNGTGFQFLDDTSSAPSDVGVLSVFQAATRVAILIAPRIDLGPSVNLKPDAMGMTNSAGTQRILLETDLAGAGSDYPVIGVGGSDPASPGYINLFAYGAQGFFKQTTTLAWEIRNGAKSGGAGQPTAGVNSGDIYLYNTGGNIVFSVSQGTVQAAGYGVFGTSPVNGSFRTADGKTVTVQGSVITSIQ